MVVIFDGPRQSLPGNRKRNWDEVTTVMSLWETRELSRVPDGRLRHDCKQGPRSCGWLGGTSRASTRSCRNSGPLPAYVPRVQLLRKDGKTAHRGSGRMLEATLGDRRRIYASSDNRHRISLASTIVQPAVGGPRCAALRCSAERPTSEGC